MGSVPILPVKRTITIGVMLYFDGDGQGHGDGDGTGKRALTHLMLRSSKEHLAIQTRCILTHVNT